LVVKGSFVRGYLDGKLIQEVGDTRNNVKSISVSAAIDDKSGDIILKAINASYEPLHTKIDLEGAGKLSGSGKAIVLTSESPLDENTLEEPTKVSPKNEDVNFSGTTISRLFPGNSFTVIRITKSGEKK